MSRPSIFDDFVCPVFARSGKCDQDALRVMEQFKNFYESKLNEIDVQGGGDSLELKCKVQRRWIDDLTEQTQMMARIVKELEDEATNRVRMLEDKLKQTSQSAYEKVFYLESDMKNLLEFIRRIREDRKWSIDGLQFYDVTHRDLFGKEVTYDSDDVRKKDTYVIPYSNGLSSEKKVKKDVAVAPKKPKLPIVPAVLVHVLPVVLVLVVALLQFYFKPRLCKLF